MATTYIDEQQRALEQRRAGLAKANRHRSYRVALKRDLKAGRRSVADIILDPPPEVATMRIFDLLLAAPKFGRVKVTKILSRGQVSPSREVGKLTVRERCVIIAKLEAS